jgi:WD40 repeat protein
MDANEIFCGNLRSESKGVCFLDSNSGLDKWKIAVGSSDGFLHIFKYRSTPTPFKHAWRQKLYDGKISCLDASPDGSFILSCTTEGSIGCSRVDLQNDCVVHESVQTSQVLNSVHFVPNEIRRAIVATKEGLLIQYDVEQNCIENIFQTAHKRNTILQALPLSSTVVLTGSTDETARLLDARAPTNETVRMKHPSWVYSVSGTVDTTMILTGCRDRALRYWDLRNPSEPVIVQKMMHRSGVTTCAFNASTNIAVSGSSDHTASVWDVASGRLMFRMQGFTDGIKRIVLSANRQLAAACAFDGTVRIYDIGFPVRDQARLVTRAGHLADDLSSTLTEFLW